ncbi:unnamed protein product [Aphanomyces euteiches]
MSRGPPTRSASQNRHREQTADLPRAQSTESNLPRPRSQPQTQRSTTPQTSGTQEPTPDQHLPPSPRQSSVDTESMNGVPGPESHDPLDELRNQALHINQLNIRLTNQGRQLERADEQIFMLRAEIEHLRNLVDNIRVSGGQPNVARREPCGMMTVRGRPCMKPKRSCVYRAAGCHPEQRQHRQSMDEDRDFDDGMEQE